MLVWIEIVCSFFFHDRATTEIYTYGHTLSLHDALPIYGQPRRGGGDDPVRRRLRPADLCPAGPAVGLDTRGDLSLHQHRQQRRGFHLIGRRSEEHTSELQSLMRISYAVFCLKKKK